MSCLIKTFLKEVAMAKPSPRYRHSTLFLKACPHLPLQELILIHSHDTSKVPNHPRLLHFIHLSTPLFTIVSPIQILILLLVTFSISSSYSARTSYVAHINCLHSILVWHSMSKPQEQERVVRIRLFYIPFFKSYKVKICYALCSNSVWLCNISTYFALLPSKMPLCYYYQPLLSPLLLYTCY